MKRKRLGFDGRRVVLFEEDFAPPGRDEVLIRTEWTLISIGTEVAVITDAAKEGKSLDLGYSHVGIIEDVGPGGDQAIKGQRVLSLAPHAEWVKVDAGPGRTVPVPEGVSPDLATLGILGSVAYHIVERASPRLVEPTAVLGQGVVGSLVLQLTNRCGVRPLIAIDVDARRLEKGRELGADHVVDASREDVVAAVSHLTNGKGVSLCIEAAASSDAYRTAVAILGLRGRLVVTSCVLEPVEFRINEDLVKRELTIMGAHQPKCPVEENPYHLWTSPRNRTATMEDILEGRLEVDHLISHRVSPDEGPAIYDRLLQKDRSLVGVALSWGGA